MSIENLERAFDLIEANQDDAFFAGERADVLIERAEQALGIEFPPSYRMFVKRFGCGNVAGLEIYGVSSDDFENSSVPNGIWLTLDERKNAGLPKELIIIGENGSGGWFALKTDERSSSDECPVIERHPGIDEMPTLAPDFGSFLLNEIQSAVGAE